MDQFTPVAGVEPDPDPELTTDDPDLLVAISQPLRMRLLIELMKRPMTAAELAATLDVPLTRLYYHLNLLEEHGAIRIVATRQVRGITEKRYRASALSYRLSRDVVRPDSDAFEKVTRALFDSTRAELAVAARSWSGRPDDDRMLLTRTVLELTPERRAEFVRRLRALVEEYADHEDVDDGERYGALLVTYPLEAGP